MSGGVEASSSQGSYATDCPMAVDMVFLGEILVGSSDTDAVPPVGGTSPSARASWLPFVRLP